MKKIRLRETVNLLSSKYKKLFWLSAFISLFSSLIETLSILVLFPFIRVVANPEIINNNKYLYYIYHLFNFHSVTSFIAAFGLIIIIFYIFRAAYSILYQYIIGKFINGISHSISKKLLNNYLSRSYGDFISQNSSDVMSTIVWESSNTAQVFSQLLVIITEVFTVTIIYTFLLIKYPIITLVMSVVLLIVAISLLRAISKYLKKQGQETIDSRMRFYKVLYKTVGNYKLIKLLQIEKYIISEFCLLNKVFSDANTKNSVIQQVPRVTIELFGVVVLVIATISAILTLKDVSSAIQLVTVFGLSFYKFLPSVNKITTGVSQLSFFSETIRLVTSQLKIKGEVIGNDNLIFESEINLSNIIFSYDTSGEILKNISLNLKKNEKIAFIGESGGGKSTLVDILIGVYSPQEGIITIDGIKLDNSNLGSWRKKVGYIPQSIYLFDGTVAENVAFGFEFDAQKVIEVLKIANIYDFFETKEGIYTKLGENGINLSGGQKQRIGIARALYGAPEILVLDEATSALDSETERIIMDEIYRIGVNYTLLIVAHRLNTITNCDRIFRVENGKVFEIGAP